VYGARAEVQPTAWPFTTFPPLGADMLTTLTGDVQRPNGVTWINDLLYISCAGDGTLYEIDATTSETRAYVAAVKNAHTLYAESVGTGRTAIELWVPDFEEGSVHHVVDRRARTVVDGLDGPWGIAYLDAESFLITNMLDDSLVAVTRSGDWRVLHDGFAAPTAIAIDSNARLVYVANSASLERSIEAVSISDLLDGEVPADTHLVVSGLENVTGLELASDGALYIAYQIGDFGRVGRLHVESCLAAGGCTGGEVHVVVDANLPAPLAGLALSDDMRLFVHTLAEPNLMWTQLPVDTNH
jgi:hypothetical protein